MLAQDPRVARVGSADDLLDVFGANDREVLARGKGPRDGPGAVPASPGGAHWLAAGHTGAGVDPVEGHPSLRATRLAATGDMAVSAVGADRFEGDLGPHPGLPGGAVSRCATQAHYGDEGDGDAERVDPPD